MSIEQGRLILTMMPSLYCKLDCPHCYLTKEQRRSKECLTTEQIQVACEKITHYYQLKKISNAAIDIYWYGGEPTTMGVAAFESMCDVINEVFKQHTVRHTLLSALVGVNIEEWTPTIKKYCNSKIQTSYDGFMRGERYDLTWQKQVRIAKEKGLKISTLSVFNKYIKEDGHKHTFNKLFGLGVNECGWLPFQKNTRNDMTGMFNEHSTSMNEFSEFMINFNLLNQSLNKNKQMLIGNELFIKSMNMNGQLMSNTGAQTLFLMPNGDMVMPDYDDYNVEFMRTFGNILNQSFNDVLTSESRRFWIRRQMSKNNNEECIKCDRWNCCLMEFFKKNNEGDDCYGAKKYVEFVVNESTLMPTTIDNIA